jgi:hypothetical protein
MTLSGIEARKERENQEHRRFRLQEAKEKIFPEMWKRGVLEESESEDGESEEEPGHGRVLCDACRMWKLACKWSGTGQIKACDRCRGFRKSCRVNGVGHWALSVKKARVVPESEAEAGEPKTPARANHPKVKSILVVGRSNGNGDWVGSGVPKDRAMSEGTSPDLRVPLVSMACNFRKLVAQNAEFLEEIRKVQNTQLDLIANLCMSLREFPYQLHLRNMGLEEANDRNTLEVSGSVQQALTLTESAEVGIQVVSEEVEDNSEIPEVAEVAEKVGMEGAGGEDETMEDA